MDLKHIFDMGHYGVYVWSAYAITLFIFGINIFSVFREKKQLQKFIKHYLTQVNKPK